MSAGVDRSRVLGDPALTHALSRFVRSRVPESDVDDIVQATLADALASPHAPADAAELRPWVWGIARNKIADFFRRSRREVPHEPDVVEETAAAESAPTTAKELLRWAERELPGGDGSEHTLEWMLREGAGEKLEAIAAEENVPAPRVRQRVARLRKHFRARWAAQIAAAAALVAIAIAIALLLRRRDDDIAKPEPFPAPSAPLAAPSEAPAVSAQPPPVTSSAVPDAQSSAPPMPAPKAKQKPTKPSATFGASDSMGSYAPVPTAAPKAAPPAQQQATPTPRK